ncbi:MAG: Rrf2 family transcriptional regulator [Clostridia bacterium]|nr:Rrf2 family transcriptional regulator [Clostridia bacterium]
MKLSTKGRYALRMMMDIAQNQHKGYVALKDIAARQEISKKYLEQIALHLSQCGMLRAVRGYQGGYMLARPTGAYTVSEILAAVEGSLAPVSCLETPVNTCPRREGCQTLPIWQGLNRLIFEYLNGITLEDVVENRVPEFSLKKI